MRTRIGVVVVKARLKLVMVKFNNWKVLVFDGRRKPATLHLMKCTRSWLLSSRFMDIARYLKVGIWIKMHKNWQNGVII